MEKQKQKNETYDESKIYNEMILPHVKEIMLLCDEYNIPFFMTCAVKNTEKDTQYESNILSPLTEDRTLKKDLISKHALVMNGFDVVPEKQELIFEEMF